MKVLPSFIASMITQRPGVQRILSNTGWLFADKFASIVSGLFVGALVARYLGPERYGILNYSIAFVALFTPFVTVGLRDIVIRDVLLFPQYKEEILGTAAVLQLSGGLLVLVLVFCFGSITQPEDSLTFWLTTIMAARFMFQALSDPPDYWFNAQVQSKYTVWARNIALILIAIVKIVLVLTKAPLIAFALALLGEAMVFSFTLLAFYRFSGQLLSTWRISITQAKKLLKNCWPLVISAIAITVYANIGKVMLKNMVSGQELGIYAAAAKISNLWYFIPVAIASSVYPSIVRSKETSSLKVQRKRIQLFFDIMAGISYVIVVPLVLLAPMVVEFLFGIDYSNAGPILRVQAWAFIFVSLGVTRSRWLMAEDLVRFNMLATILGAIANVVLNFVLIPRYGALGVVWATIISQAISTYFSSLLFKRLWPVFIQQTLSLLVPFRFFSLKRSLTEILKTPRSAGAEEC
jgi:PST family polysaccharide transporter